MKLKLLLGLSIVAISLLIMSCNDDKQETNNLFSLMHKGAVLANGATIAEQEFKNGLEQLSCDISVVNNTAAAINVKVKKEVLSKTPADVAEINYFCFGDQCIIAQTYEYATLIPAKSELANGLLFTGDLTTSTIPAGRTEVQIKYLFSDTDSDFSRSVIVTYICNK